MLNIITPRPAKTLRDLFNNYLDDQNKQVDVQGYTYEPSQVLYYVDPIAYKDTFLNFCNALLDEGEITQNELDEAFGLIDGDNHD